MTHDGLPDLPGALRLHYNENTSGCSPVVQAALRDLTRADIGRYPEIDAITARVARWFGTDDGWVLVTNGLDEGINVVAQAGAWHLDPLPGGQTAEFILVEPTFEVYETCAAIVNAREVRIPPDPDFRFPLDAVRSAIGPATRVIYLTDPNNPTGVGIPAGAVSAIAAAAPGALVFLDEAYGDFSGRTLIGPLLEQQRNVVVGRTFAKAHGLAALRIGALVAHPDTIARVRAMQLPFSVNVAAITALAAALDDRTYLEGYVAESAASRELIYACCRRLGLGYVPSEANFVLVSVGDRARAVAAALRARHILVRDKSSTPGCAGCLRMTAGRVEDTRTALSAMEDILATLPD